jgi:hypothetical protein
LSLFIHSTFSLFYLFPFYLLPLASLILHPIFCLHLALRSFSSLPRLLSSNSTNAPGQAVVGWGEEGASWSESARRVTVQ